MFVSNMIFGQGMDSMADVCHGSIGFLSGVLFRKGMLRRDRVSLAVFSGLWCFVYGYYESCIGINVSIQGYMVCYCYLLGDGSTFDVIHGAATVFLLIAGEPMLEKLIE